MAKRGPKPKAKAKTKPAKKRNYAAERAKAEVRKGFAGASQVTVTEMRYRRYIEKINETLYRLSYEDREEIPIPVSLPKGSVFTSERSIKEKYRDSDGKLRTRTVKQTVTTVIPGPDCNHAGWARPVVGDLFIFMAITERLKPETLEMLRLSRAYNNLVHEAAAWPNKIKSYSKNGIIAEETYPLID